MHGAAARLHPARVRARWALRRVRDGAVGPGAAVPAVPAGVRGHHAHRRPGGAPHGARPVIKGARAKLRLISHLLPALLRPRVAATASNCTAPQARVEPVHYLLREAGPGQTSAAAERVRDVGSAAGRDSDALPLAILPPPPLPPPPLESS